MGEVKDYTPIYGTDEETPMPPKGGTGESEITNRDISKNVLDGVNGDELLKERFLNDALMEVAVTLYIEKEKNEKKLKKIMDYVKTLPEYANNEGMRVKYDLTEILNEKEIVDRQKILKKLLFGEK